MQIKRLPPWGSLFLNLKVVLLCIFQVVIGKGVGINTFSGSTRVHLIDTFLLEHLLNLAFVIFLVPAKEGMLIIGGELGEGLLEFSV